MRLALLSLFPEIIRPFFESSIMARAVRSGLVEYRLIDIRDHAHDKHRKCDDEVYGGGAGMLLMAPPLGEALVAAGAKKIGNGGPRVIFLTPSGRLFNQRYAEDLAREDELVVICGHYEGIDQRIISSFVTDEISLGDFVLSSGESAALVLVDALYRLVPGVIKEESLSEESFALRGEGGPPLLEYPQFTRPANYDTIPVPPILSSGHHAQIARWRLKEQIRKTLAYRPELLARNNLPKELVELVAQIIKEETDD